MTLATVLDVEVDGAGLSRKAETGLELCNRLGVPVAAELARRGLPKDCRGSSSRRCPALFSTFKLL